MAALTDDVVAAMAFQERELMLIQQGRSARRSSRHGRRPSDVAGE